jgi:hypothetical protein
VTAGALLAVHPLLVTGPRGCTPGCHRVLQVLRDGILVILRVEQDKAAGPSPGTGDQPNSRQRVCPVAFTQAFHHRQARRRPPGCPEVSEHLAHHLFLSARDLGRLGTMMLQGGRRNDRQVVPGS